MCSHAEIGENEWQFKNEYFSLPLRCFRSCTRCNNVKHRLSC